jgi:hypothetical protein
MPIYVAVVHRPSIPTTEEIKTLPGLLNTRIGFDAMHQFLKLEFSLENLLFWKEVWFA